MKRLVLVTLIFCALWFLFEDKSFACSCAPSESAKEALKESSAVFTGRLVSARLVKDPELGEEIEATFRVDSYWKGVKAQETTVFTPSSGVACGKELTIGQWYLVFASASYDRKGKLVVTKCGRTKFLYDRQAQRDVKDLGVGKSF